MKHPLADDPQLVDRVLERMANGEILTAICVEIGVTPGAFSHYAARDADFGQRYAHARKMQAAAIAEDVVRVADEEDDPAKGRVRSDARKWLASRLDPEKFGDRNKTELTGADGTPLIPVLNVVLSDKQR
jgi:hypothetical protein